MAGTWYRSGTVSVTHGAKVVTGLGTEFTKFVSEGFIFMAGGQFCEVDTIDSDVQLTLVEEFDGSTASNIKFACAPTQATIPPLTRRVTQMLKDVGAVKDAYQAGDIASTLALDERAKKSELQAADGSTQIGSDGPVATPYLQTLSDIQAGNPVSLFRFVNPARIPSMRAFTALDDASLGVQEAFDSGAKRLVAEYGLFNLESTIDCSAGLTLEGAGMGTIFTQRSVSGRGSFDLKSASSVDFIEGVRFRNFVLNCLTGTFAEQQHLIALNGVSGFQGLGLYLAGFRGDAVYLGSGGAGEERHNKGVSFAYCTFDGINNQNRNAISIIDCDGLWAENNDFLRCTRPDMPGPIDMEPNTNSWHVVRNIAIRRNRFRGCGGNIGEVAVQVPGVVAAVPSNIVVEANDSDGYIGTGAFFSHSTGRLPTDSSDDSCVKLLRNVVSNGNRPWAIFDGKSHQLVGNTWRDFKQSVLVGYTGMLNFVRKLSIEGDRYIRCGSVGGKGMDVFGVAGLSFRRTDFIDCGKGAVGSYAIDFNAGASSQVEFNGVDISSPTGKTVVAIQKEGSHTFDSASNSFLASDVHGLPNFFQAQNSDSLEIAWTPIVVGTTTPGVGTYTKQLGYIQSLGKRCFVRGEIAFTSHTGVGILTIGGFPRPVRQSGGQPQTPWTISIQGVTSSGGQVGHLIQNSTVAGVAGALQCFGQGTGAALVNITIPAGSVNVVIRFQGSYLTD